MLRKLLLLASLPLMALPSASLAASPVVAASLSSQPISRSEFTNNKPVLISQYYPGRPNPNREMRRRCRWMREYLRENRDSLSERELRREWKRYHRLCDEIQEGY